MRIFLLAAASLALPVSILPATACPDQEALVLRIEFAGLRRIPSETLRAHITSRASRPLDCAQVAADVRALDALGWFDSVAAETYPADDPSGEADSPGLRLVFQMAERPFLAGVEFRGSAELAPDRIKALLNENRIRMKLAAPVDRTGLWHAARIIERSLADLGHPQARVRVRLDAVPTASVRAVFEIDDGPRITAGRVAFSGVHAFPEKLLRRRMQRVAPEAHFAGLRSKDIYTPERLADDVDRVESLYRDHGYLQVRVGAPEVQIVEERTRRTLPWLRPRTAQRLHVLIPVDEGAAHHFSSLDVEGESLSAVLKERASALPEIRALRTGALYSQEKLERAREAVNRMLTHEAARAASGAGARSSPGGPLAPQVDVALQADPRAGAIRVALQIREAHPYIVRRLEFSGQRRFSDRYYRRHIRLHEGDSFRPEIIEAGLSQLARAGYIRAPRKEDLAVRFDESHHTADLAVHVEEIGRQKISLVGGHAGLGSTAGVVYSVFDLLGGEELLAGHLEGGPDSLQTLLNLTKEAVFGTRVSFGLSVYQNIVRPNLPFNGRRRHVFTSRTTGFTLAVTAPVSQGDTLGLTYGISHASTRYHFDLPADVSGIVNPSLSSSTSTHALGWHWSHESAREHLEADSSISGGWLGGTQNQVRPSADYTRLLPDPFTQRRNTWAVRGAFAGAASLRGDLPLQDRLFAGDDYVRGFRTGELTPYAAVTSHATSGSGTFRAQSPGADLVGAINAEYRVPLASNTELAGFYDAGSGWLLPNWLGLHRPTLVAGTNGDWRASTGVEVRWQIPGVGQTVRVHLSVNPLRLARTLALPDGTHFHPPDRLLAVGWALGSPF